eukprot:771457-Pelagomonas_calceolata.AAC.1
MAANTFIQQKKHLFPRSLLIAREQTSQTLLRNNKCVKPVCDAIDKVISVKPELRGLKTHIASNIVLSYSNRREALDPRSPAAAFVYPIWQHVHIDKVTNKLINDTALLSHLQDPIGSHKRVQHHQGNHSS